MMENFQNVLRFSQQKTGTAAYDRSKQIQKWHSQEDEEGEKIPRLPYKIIQSYEVFSYDKLNKLCEMLTLQILNFLGLDVNLAHAIDPH